MLTGGKAQGSTPAALLLPNRGPGGTLILDYLLGAWSRVTGETGGRRSMRMDAYLPVCVCMCVRAHVCVCVCSCVQLIVIPWTVAHQALLSMQFSKQEYWSGLQSPHISHKILSVSLWPLRFHLINVSPCFSFQNVLSYPCPHSLWPGPGPGPQWLSVL